MLFVALTFVIGITVRTGGKITISDSDSYEFRNETSWIRLMCVLGLKLTFTSRCSRTLFIAVR